MKNFAHLTHFLFLAFAGCSAVTGRDLQHAISFSIVGWPSNEILSLAGDRSRPTDIPVLDPDSEGMSPVRACVRGDRDDPFAAVL